MPGQCPRCGKVIPGDYLTHLLQCQAPMSSASVQPAPSLQQPADASDHPLSPTMSGGTARNDLEDAKKEVNGLEAEKKVLQEEIQSMNKQGLAEFAKGKEGFVKSFGEVIYTGDDPVIVQTYTTKIADLKDQLKSVMKQLEEAQRQKTLAMEAQQQGGGGGGGALGDNSFIVDGMLQKRFVLYRQYLPDHVTTSELSSNKTTATDRKRRISDILGNACVVCKREYVRGPNNPVGVAHIVKTRTRCEENGLTFYDKEDVSNFLLLCGVESEENSCHGQFDTLKMSFRHVTNKDSRQWVVIGGGWRHGIMTIINSKPHRRALHAHLTFGLVNKLLNIPEVTLGMPEEVSVRGVSRITPGEVDKEQLSDSPPRNESDSPPEIEPFPSDTEEE